MTKTIAIPVDKITGEPKISTEMKVAFIGEFSWVEEAPFFDENGDLHPDNVQTIVVPWTICKEIYKRMATAAACESNQMTPAEADIALLQAALFSLIGTDNKDELRQMLDGMPLISAPYAAKEAMINAINALLATMTSPPHQAIDCDGEGADDYDGEETRF